MRIKKRMEIVLGFKFIFCLSLRVARNLLLFLSPLYKLCGLKDLFGSSQTAQGISAPRAVGNHPPQECCFWAFECPPPLMLQEVLAVHRTGCLHGCAHVQIAPSSMGDVMVHMHQVETPPTFCRLARPQAKCQMLAFGWVSGWWSVDGFEMCAFGQCILQTSRGHPGPC